MPNKKFWDNSSLQKDITWDNQTLPGLSDDQLFNTNWNLHSSKEDYLKRAKKRSLKQKESNEKRIPKIKKTVSQQFKDPNYKKFRTEIIKKICATDEWRTAQKEGIKKRDANGWYEKRGKAYKPIQTPYGRFESKKAAVEAMTSLGIVNAAGKLSTYLKTKSTEYFYIEK